MQDHILGDYWLTEHLDIAIRDLELEELADVMKLDTLPEFSIYQVLIGATLVG